MPSLAQDGGARSPIERIAFFGTPAFAVPTLEALAAAGRTPVLVVSQPSRASGRGRRAQPPPVAAWALENGVELVQPPKVNNRAFRERLEALDLDVAVVVAFGQIFPQRLLDIPRLGCINVHASLLPRHRGAAPIAAAIAAGDEETGVDTMIMEAGLDSGPVLLERRTPIGERETAGELSERLAVLGGKLLVETLDRLEAGDLEPRPQPEEGVTHAPRIEKSDGIVDWDDSAEVIDRRLRAFTPWPGSTTTLRDRHFKLIEARPIDRTSPGKAPGEIVGVGSPGIEVSCGDGSVLLIERAQRPGRRAMQASDLINGERLEAGERFSMAPVVSEAS